MSLILLQCPPADQGILRCLAVLYPAPLRVARQMLSRHLVLAGVWGRSHTVSHGLCFWNTASCWTFYHETVSVLADSLEGGQIKSCAGYISLVLLD